MYYPYIRLEILRKITTNFNQKIVNPAEIRTECPEYTSTALPYTDLLGFFPSKPNQIFIWSEILVPHCHTTCHLGINLHALIDLCPKVTGTNKGGWGAETDIPITTPPLLIIIYRTLQQYVLALWQRRGLAWSASSSR